MQAREFLELARELFGPGASARHWRGAIIHAYYALLLECREAMARWGLPALTRQQVHAQVRLRLIYATDLDLKEVGQRLEQLAKHRNSASYDLRDLRYSLRRRKRTEMSKQQPTPLRCWTPLTPTPSAVPPRLPLFGREATGERRNTTAQSFLFPATCSACRKARS